MSERPMQAPAPRQDSARDRGMARAMALRADRTLVKSPPELWELVDDRELMRRWCAGLLGSADPVDVTVTSRSRGERIAWRATSEGSQAVVELTLAEKGFGTNVAISAACDRALAGDILDALLDELASPQRRPFTRA